MIRTLPAESLTTRAEAIRSSQLVIGLIAICAIVFSYLSVTRHYAFNTAAYDLAMYDQAVWNTSQGRWFEINLLEDTMPGLTNKLGDHVEPILLPLALLYRIRSNADVLLVVQALALAALIWPLFHLVRNKTNSAFMAGISLVLYLAHPATWNALLFDFHPVTLAAAFLMFALWTLVQKRRVACLIFALLAMACKEHIGLMAALLGVYALFFHKSERRLGAILIAVGLAGSILAFGVINPAFQPTGVSPYLNRYGRLGSSLTEVLLAPFTKPDVVWSILTNPNRISYYSDLLLPLGGLPLLGAEMILPALPDIALNTFSAFAPARTLDYHYGVMIAPFLILAAAWGADRLARGLNRMLDRFQHARRGTGKEEAFLPPRHQDTKSSWGLRVVVVSSFDRKMVFWLAGVWMIVSMATYHVTHYQAFLPLSDRYASTFTFRPRHAIGLQIAAVIPADAIVSAQFNLVSHISQRQRAHIFPRIDDAEYVFLDTQGIIEPFQSQAEYEAAIEAVRNDPSFQTVTERDGFILLRRR